MPCALMPAILEWSRWRSSRRATPCPGGASGELWTGDGVVLAHDFRFGRGGRAAHERGPRREPPSSSAGSARSWGSSDRHDDVPTSRTWSDRPRLDDAASARSSRRPRASAPSSPARTSLDDVRSTSTATRQPRAALARRRRGRLVRRARGARRLPRPRARPARSARRTASCVRPALPPRRRGARHRRVRLRRGRASSAACSRSRASSPVITSEDVREELATIAPERECDRLAELSGALPLGREPAPARRGSGRCTSTSASGARAGARSRCCATAGSARRSARTAAARSTGDPLPAPRRRRRGRARVLVAAGVVDRRHAPLERPPRRVVARACCRAAYLRGAFLGGGSLSLGRSPHLELRTASLEAALLREVAGAEGVELAVAERATHAVAYAKSWDAIESLLALVGASGDRARARGARRRRRDARAREPPRERRPREPRRRALGGRAAAPRVELAAVARPRARARTMLARARCPDRARPRAPAPPSDGLPARARRPRRSAGDEGRDAPPLRRLERARGRRNHAARLA